MGKLAADAVDHIALRGFVYFGDDVATVGLDAPLSDAAEVREHYLTRASGHILHESE